MILKNNSFFQSIPCLYSLLRQLNSLQKISCGKQRKSNWWQNKLNEAETLLTHPWILERRAKASILTADSCSTVWSEGFLYKVAPPDVQFSGVI